jgi:all-trans-8'-apo-beta-carotenal 15,15'-oxygenase
MNRRRFLASLSAAAAGLALASRLLHAGTAAEAFAKARAEQPWLAGWQSVQGEAFGPSSVTLEGRLPEGLVGTLYRNGPAVFERGGQRYSHWFDGDGLVQAWNIGPRGIEHRARLVGTPKLKREQAADRFLLPAAGSRIDNPISIRNNDDVNVANTSVTVIDGRLFALWEGGSAFELDPASLDTLGPVAWMPELTAAPFSAHPLREADGSLWNFGSLDMLGGSGLLIWRIGADAKLSKHVLIPTPARGYLHAFAMTRRHLVFVLTPYRLGEEGPFFERLKFAPDLPCQIAVVPKDALDSPRWFEAEFGMAYHFGDAFEREGQIELRAVLHQDLQDAAAPMAATMRGEPEPVRSDGGVRLASLHIDIKRGSARWQRHEFGGLEFQQFDPRSAGDRGACLYAPEEVAGREVAYFNAVTGIDLQRERVQRHVYGARTLAEEHLFVPRPGSTEADDGWLLGTVLDSARDRSGLVVLDAKRIEDGPLATAWLERSFPLGFHGHFATA